MKCNINGIDGVLRVIVGIVLITLSLMGTIGWWGWLGLILIATGLFRFCPMYTMLNLSTCNKE
jgi:hypothetical protein